jgi:hypothetical protein
VIAHIYHAHFREVSTYRYLVQGSLYWQQMVSPNSLPLFLKIDNFFSFTGSLLIVTKRRLQFFNLVFKTFLSKHFVSMAKFVAGNCRVCTTMITIKSFF